MALLRPNVPGLSNLRGDLAGRLTAAIVALPLALEELIDRAVNADKDVYLIGLTPRVARLMGKLGPLDVIRETNRFESRDAAFRAMDERLAPGDSSA